jgi:transcriptional regulator with XRE-family HTH domain
VVAPRQTNRPLAEELPNLLRDKRMSLRRLATAAHVDHGHLSRVLRRQRGKTAGPDLARRVAEALDLPADFFPEYREWVVIERIQADPSLRDELYRKLAAE